MIKFKNINIKIFSSLLFFIVIIFTFSSTQTLAQKSRSQFKKELLNLNKKLKLFSEDHLASCERELGNKSYPLTTSFQDLKGDSYEVTILNKHDAEWLFYCFATDKNIPIKKYPKNYCWVKSHFITTWAENLYGIKMAKAWVLAKEKSALNPLGNPNVFWSYHTVPIVAGLNAQEKPFDYYNSYYAFDIALDNKVSTFGKWMANFDQSKRGRGDMFLTNRFQYVALLDPKTQSTSLRKSFNKFDEDLFQKDLTEMWKIERGEISPP